MEQRDEGLGRGIEDISHLFLSARGKRTSADGPAGGAGPPGPVLVWPVIRAGNLPAETTWRMAWRLAPTGTHGMHLTVGSHSTEIRWLGQAETPPKDRPAPDVIDRADTAVIDLTDAPRAARDQIALAAGQLVVVGGPEETDCLAAYSLIKSARDALPKIALGLEVTGDTESVEAAWSRMRDAVGYFLKTDLVDWRQQYPLPDTETTGPEPPLVAAVPTDAVLGALCGLASRARPAPTPSRMPVGAPAPANRAASKQRPRPLLDWPDPDAAELADFIEQHPHLVQPDLIVLDRALHAARAEAVDLLGRDSVGRAIVVLVSKSGDAALLASGLRLTRWCQRERALLSRLHARLHLGPDTPPRLVLAACRFDEDVLEAARMMQRPAVSLIELRAYELEGERAVAVARVV